ncbi:hypothetical protein JCM19231_5299 [Vibrio ishigakensis]|uniref:Uncharacterized protein n=1 Tax=Vibrio ishigakensis TaxID=1481914 RepID=A0A0B8NLE1_9VIBR|nr:hypothetical protein JCM19231_5299 [Vibrio ishigakensis]
MKKETSWSPLKFVGLWADFRTTDREHIGITEYIIRAEFTKTLRLLFFKETCLIGI